VGKVQKVVNVGLSPIKDNNIFNYRYLWQLKNIMGCLGLSFDLYS
jgi:hypothetical protein